MSASRVAARSLSSRTFAPATTNESGPPSASTRRLRFTPFLPRSVGFGPTRSPPNVPCPSPRRPPATPSSLRPTPRTPRPAPPRSAPAPRAPPTAGRPDARSTRRGTPWGGGSIGSQYASERSRRPRQRAGSTRERPVLFGGSYSSKTRLDLLPQLVWHAP